MSMLSPRFKKKERSTSGVIDLDSEESTTFSKKDSKKDSKKEESKKEESKKEESKKDEIKKEESKKDEIKRDDTDNETQDQDEFNVSDVLKDLIQTKLCTTCAAVIPTTCVSCFSCHSLQPFNMLLDVSDYVPYKSDKGFSIKRQMVYDTEDPSRGVVWKNVVFKVGQTLQYFIGGAGVRYSFNQDEKKKKKERKAYVDGLQLVTSLPKLQQLSGNYSSNGGDVVHAFVEAVKSVREEMLKDAKKLMKSREIVYEALWFLFERGSPIYYTDTTTGFIFGTIVSNWDYRSGFSSSFVISGTTIKCDGQFFFEFPITTSIPAFSGIINIDNLPVKKLTRLVYEALRERGRLYSSVATGAHFKQYKGFLLTESLFGYMKFLANGRIMLDTSTYNRMNPNTNKFKADQNMKRRNYDPITGNEIPDSNSLEIKVLKEGQYWMTYPTIPGFSFLLKKWGEFLVENVSDIIFDDHSFIQLVLPEDKKKMIKALVEEHQNSNGTSVMTYTTTESKTPKEKKKKDINGLNRQPDLIKNKGGGCIFLLHGPPGVGKTLTAEAVSEHLHIPLYQVTVGELGTDPPQLEKSLGNLLELAALWNASILLDEADIFLERRSRNDILRNAMVGIFLRLLEYHQGVLFLTTNRVDCLDEAFSSRISVALYYPILDKSARKEVWKNFLIESTPKTTPLPAPKSKKVAKITEISYDFDKLSEFELNGRQIRSCVRMARALANSEKAHLTQDYLIQTIRLTLDFSARFERQKITHDGNGTEGKNSEENSGDYV